MTKRKIYARAAKDYYDSGWDPLPLLNSGKGTVPGGFTGYDGRETTEEDVLGWTKKHPRANICIHLPVDVVGIDVDDYEHRNEEGKVTLAAGTASASLAALVEKHGELPPTVRSSSRFGEDYDAATGIRFYRLPEKYAALARTRGRWRAGPEDSPGIDTIRFGHRQAVVWPSIHPGRGTEYQIMDEETGEIRSEPLPDPDDLPLLPHGWCESLVKPERAKKPRKQRSKAATKVEEPEDWWTSGDPCQAVERSLTRWIEQIGSGAHRYDSMVKGQVALTRLGEQGHEGVASAIESLRDMYSKAVGDERDTDAEWWRAASGLVAELEREGLTDLGSRGCCGAKKAEHLRDRLVALAESEFTIGRTVDDLAFLIDSKGPNIARFGGAAKSRLAVRLREGTGKSPGRTPLDEAWLIIEGLAADVESTELPLRCGPLPDGRGYVLDLGDPEGCCVQVTESGWEVLHRSPIPFRRSRATGVHPFPERGGDWDSFWRIVNVKPEDRLLVRAYLASTLLADLPHVILRITGEHGSAKTTAASYLGRVIDPSTVDTISPPKSSDKWETIVNARWVVPVDNVSRIEPWWSDDLCRTSTGSGTLERTLYTNAEVSTKFLRACVILNGISMSGSLRADLADRMLAIELDKPNRYRTERDIREEFAVHHSQILGLILDDAVSVLSALGTVAAPSDLRMADFAEVLAAFDAGHGLDEETGALAAFRAKVKDSADEAFEEDALGRCVVEFMRDFEEWTGTFADLLSELDNVKEGFVSTHELAEDGYFPKSATGLARTITRSSRHLRERGITIKHHRRESRKRLVTIKHDEDDDDGG